MSKKVILILTLLVTMSFTFTSCKNDKKEEATSKEVKTEKNKQLASNVLYQCLMDCEHGKTYAEPGKCPVCNMALKEKKFDKDGNELCAKCGKTKAECAKEHADGKVCAICGKDKSECKGHDGHNHGDGVKDSVN
jgi:hypothetical protein